MRADSSRGRKATSSEVTTWTSMTGSILALREHLIAERVTCVVIESTAASWKPFYFLLSTTRHRRREDATRVCELRPPYRSRSFD